MCSFGLLDNAGLVRGGATFAAMLSRLVQIRFKQELRFKAKPWCIFVCVNPLLFIHSFLRFTSKRLKLFFLIFQL